MASIQRKFQDLIYLVWRQKRWKGRPAAAGGGLIGSQDPLLPGGRPKNFRTKYFDLPETVLRPLLLDRALSIELVEAMTWSSVLSGSVRILAQNVFQHEDGRIESWKIKTTYIDPNDNIEKPLPPERMPHPDIIKIAEELADRRCGKRHVLGGERLVDHAFNCFGYGDSFLELGLCNDGFGNYVIADSLSLPTWSLFVEEDEAGHVVQYRQQSDITPRDTDRIWDGYHVAKILHFKHDDKGRYGWPATFAQIEAWRKFKQVSADLEEAARSSIAPWLHILPEGRSEDYKQQYRSEYESIIEQGLVSNIYLLAGSDVRKAASATPTLKPLLDVYNVARIEMCANGIPLWLVPGLGIQNSGGASKELGGQPALTYARLVSHLRSILAQEIVFAIGLEVTMSKSHGYEFWLEHRKNVDVSFPRWVAQQIPGLQTSNNVKKPPEQQEEEAKETFIRLNGEAAKKVFYNPANE